jgi:hypothetical protein
VHDALGEPFERGPVVDLHLPQLGAQTVPVHADHRRVAGAAVQEVLVVVALRANSNRPRTVSYPRLEAVALFTRASNVSRIGLRAMNPIVVVAPARSSRAGA